LIRQSITLTNEAFLMDARDKLAHDGSRIITIGAALNREAKSFVLNNGGGRKYKDARGAAFYSASNEAAVK
jgi:hypothetical protein